MVLIFAGVLGACAEDTDYLSVAMDDVAYDVPTAHVQSYTREPHQFVRIKGPDHGFELAYDSRSTQRTAPNGWPVIFSLNDGRAPNVEYFDAGGQKIVCRKASAPDGGCGFKLVDQGAQWSVLFPQERLESVADIQAEAASQLEAYRRNSESG